MPSNRGEASWAKMTTPWGKLAEPLCHPTKKVNKPEELTYLYVFGPIYKVLLVLHPRHKSYIIGA